MLTFLILLASVLRFIPSTLLAIIATTIYLLLIHHLRHHRSTTIPQTHNLPTRASLSTMTADQAHFILKDLVELEFPKTMGLSLVFALFRTYAIPSISSLLIATGELSRPETASKRTADLGMLVLEFCLNAPSSERAMEAVARMNFLHSAYVQAGKIRNEDLVYTLAILASEPVRSMGLYEWRNLTDVEICASATFWKSMGDRMGVDYSMLPGAKQGWCDGLQWYEEIVTWADQYEEAQMVPAEMNRRMVSGYVDLVFLNLPKRIEVFGRYIVAFMGGERWTRAVMFEPPPPAFRLLAICFLVIRKLVLRHLSLPRFIRRIHISAEKEANGKYSPREYLSHPWYVKPTFERR